MHTTRNTEPPAEPLEALVAWFDAWDRVVVAFSGGVDSSVVAAAAARSAARVVVVTAVSPSVPTWQREIAAQVAAQIGVEHRLVETDEVDDQDYVRNDSRRCFHCKTTLYRNLADVCRDSEAVGGNENSPRRVTVSGTNADDLGDHRPGIQAGRDAGVRTPLAELGFGKTQVRALATRLGLSNADLPASPCLASRIAYGVEVTPARLGKIERAENWLRDQGFGDVRVRLHPGELARVEVPAAEVSRLAGTELAARTAEELRRLGFPFVTIDPLGLQSGSLNRTIVELKSPAGDPLGP